MAAGAISTSNHPKLLWPGVKGIWGQQYNEHTPEYPDLYDVDSSDKNYEEFLQITGFGLAPVKAQGAAAVYDTETQGPVTRMVHAAYALGYIVTHEELSDNLYMEVSSNRARSNARSFRQTKERIAAANFNRATNTSYLWADGKTMLATDHPNTSGGTFSNKLAVAADLSEASIEDAAIQIMQATDDRGMLINLMPQSLHVAPANWFEATRILNTTLQVGTSNNDINAVKALGIFPKGVKMNHYFTVPKQWFIRTNIERGKGLVFLQRENMSFERDNDFNTKNALALGYERYSCGLVDPRAVYGSEGP
jgi:hypothetical protein